MAQLIKIRVTLSLEVDPDTWTLEYGTDGRSAIRDDAKSYVLEQVAGCTAAESGAIAKVDLA